MIDRHLRRVRRLDLDHFADHLIESDPHQNQGWTGQDDSDQEMPSWIAANTMELVADVLRHGRRRHVAHGCFSTGSVKPGPSQGAFIVTQ